MRADAHREPPKFRKGRSMSASAVLIMEDARRASRVSFPRSDSKVSKVSGVAMTAGGAGPRRASRVSWSDGRF